MSRNLIKINFKSCIIFKKKYIYFNLYWKKFDMKANSKNILKNKYYYKNLAKENKIFLYPTDSIYWIGAIANKENSKKIYKIKKRDKNKALSIIAPNKSWIKENFITKENFEERFKYYFENYKTITLLLEKVDKNSLPGIWINNKVWIRIIKHPFQDFINYLWEAFITTSANLSSKANINNPNQLDKEVFENIDIIVDEWNIYGKASTIIDFTDNEKIIRN